MNKKRVPRWWMVVGLLLLGLGASFTIAFRPLSAFWLQQQAGAIVVEASRTLPPETAGFACLANPIVDAGLLAQLKQATIQLEEVSRVFPNQAHVYYLLGRAYCMIGDYAAAVRFLPRFSELRPKNPQADLELGFALEKLCPPSGECEGMSTAEVWRRAGVLPEHLIANGEAARKKEDFEQALAWYRRAEGLGADLASTLAYVEYQWFLKQGKEEEAYAALHKAVDLDSGWADAQMRFLGWYWYGNMLNYKGEYVRAENIYLICEIIASEVQIEQTILSEFYRFLGLAIANQNRIEESLNYFKQAIDLNPKNVWGLIHYGKYLYFSSPKNLQYAQSLFKEALRISNYDRKILENLINFWKDQDNEEMIKGLCEYTKSISDYIPECMTDIK